MLASDDFLDEEIFEEEVSYAIKKLKQYKAPGLDGLPPELFKALNDNLTSLLTWISMNGWRILRGERVH